MNKKIIQNILIIQPTNYLTNHFKYLISNININHHSVAYRKLLCINNINNINNYYYSNLTTTSRITFSNTKFNKNLYAFCSNKNN